MRTSTTESIKLYLAEEDHDEFDQTNLAQAQRRIKARGETLKVMRGLVCLADWLVYEYEESASAARLLSYSHSPAALYNYTP